MSGKGKAINIRFFLAVCNKYVLSISSWAKPSFTLRPHPYPPPCFSFSLAVTAGHISKLRSLALATKPVTLVLGSAEICTEKWLLPKTLQTSCSPTLPAERQPAAWLAWLLQRLAARSHISMEAQKQPGGSLMHFPVICFETGLLTRRNYEGFLLLLLLVFAIYKLLKQQKLNILVKHNVFKAEKQ